MYKKKKKDLDFEIRYIDPHGPRLRLVVLTSSVCLSEHISLTKIINNQFKEIRDSFPKYFENRIKKNLKLLYFPIFYGFLPKISVDEYSWICKWANLHILLISSEAMLKLFFGTTVFNQSMFTTSWDVINLPYFYTLFAKMYQLIFMNM